MTLTDSEIMRAAEIAARKFGSHDPAIDHEDFVQFAAIRILSRDPDTVGTAVVVGREGIAREIGYAKYRKEAAANTARGVNVDRSDRVTKIGQLPSPERKKRRHSQEIIRLVGRPLRTFGKFGVVYPASAEPSLASVYFDPADSVSSGNRKRRLLVKSQRVTPAIRKLAESHYVLMLVDNGKSKKTNAACLAGCKRKSTVSKACGASNR